MRIVGPKVDIRAQSEEILRSLPQWFGIEEGLLAYAEATSHLPTFALMNEQSAMGFISLDEHFSESWEVHCMLNLTISRLIFGDRQVREECLEARPDVVPAIRQALH
ncbi:hypothetical protein [Candidatus Rariloculus sp.]|uniref:hypothetical protein n=1 Tax=Candidatus Rariloculus sp. TaxID=3101265 RepID=UPI003D12098B